MAPLDPPRRAAIFSASPRSSGVESTSAWPMPTRLASSATRLTVPLPKTTRWAEP
jgi:hypothetical protein